METEKTFSEAFSSSTFRTYKQVDIFSNPTWAIKSTYANILSPYIFWSTIQLQTRYYLSYLAWKVMVCYIICVYLTLDLKELIQNWGLRVKLKVVESKIVQKWTWKSSVTAAYCRVARIGRYTWKNYLFRILYQWLDTYSKKSISSFLSTIITAYYFPIA